MAAKRSKPEATDPPVQVLQLGFAGGSIRLGHHPESGYWYRVAEMSLSFWGEDDDDHDHTPAKVASVPQWEKDLTWSEVLARLAQHHWQRLSPVEVHPRHAQRVRRAIESEQLSAGWIDWLGEKSAPPGTTPADRKAAAADTFAAALRAEVSPFDALGHRRVDQMRSLLRALTGLWEPKLPADIDAILALIPKEHWTLETIAEDDPSPRVRELAAAIDRAWKRTNPSKTARAKPKRTALAPTKPRGRSR